MNSIAHVPMVELQHVSVNAGQTTILDNLDISIRRRACVGILGPNGAGKSTLLSLFNATLKPSSGQVLLFGQNPWTARAYIRAKLRHGVGTVLQHGDYNPAIPLQARDVVALGRHGGKGLAGMLTPADTLQIDHAMERMAILHLARRPYRDLSGGEQQKVQLARAMAQDPGLLLLDEPTSGLDLDWQERCVALIEHLSTHIGISLVMTTHILSHLPACCSQVVLLRRGRILASGAPGEVLTENLLSELYDCRVRIVEHQGRRHALTGGQAC